MLDYDDPLNIRMQYFCKKMLFMPSIKQRREVPLKVAFYKYEVKEYLTGFFLSHLNFLMFGLLMCELCPAD